MIAETEQHDPRERRVGPDFLGLPRLFKRTPPGTAELVALSATLMMLNALSIDIMLPALPAIDAAFTIGNPNDRQLIVVGYILAFGAGQFFFGPISDAWGRRRILIACLAGYSLGAFLCVMAWTFPALVIARLLQGIAAAGVRVLAVAIIRDLTSGSRLAKVLSLAMSIFMITPVIAPAIGQLVLLVAPWRWTFGVLVITGVSALIWVCFRLPETLPIERRCPLRWKPSGYEREGSLHASGGFRLHHWRVASVRGALRFHRDIAATVCRFV